MMKAVGRAAIPQGAAVCVAALLALGSAVAQPVTGCPLIRPTGLTPEEVDAVVATRMAQALQRKPSELDPTQAFQALSAAERAEGIYRYMALAVNEALGVDVAAEFQRLAKSLGSERPHEVLSLEAMQDVAREVYARAADLPPPPASTQQLFRLEGVTVAAPAFSSGWQLLRCGHDQVAWWRRGAADDESVNAVLRIIAMPPWTDAAAFIAHLRASLLATVPPGYRVRSLQLEPRPDGSRRCADARLVARAESAPWRMRARFCYAEAADAAFGHAALFSHAGSDDVPRFEQEAEDFFSRIRNGG